MLCCAFVIGTVVFGCVAVLVMLCVELLYFYPVVELTHLTFMITGTSQQPGSRVMVMRDDQHIPSIIINHDSINDLFEILYQDNGEKEQNVSIDRINDVLLEQTPSSFTTSLVSTPLNKSYTSYVPSPSDACDVDVTSDVDTGADVATVGSTADIGASNNSVSGGRRDHSNSPNTRNSIVRSNSDVEACLAFDESFGHDHAMTEHILSAMRLGEAANVLQLTKKRK